MMFFIEERKNMFGHKTVETIGPDTDTSSRFFFYKHNESGFRCDSFNQTSEFPILFSGCSQTFGTGLPLEETWSHLLYNKIKNYKKIDIPYWSLAVGGSSIELQSIFLYHFIDLLKPKLIFMLMPPIYRRTLKVENKHTTYIPHLDQFLGSVHLTTNEKYTLEKAKALFIDEGYSRFESLKSLMMIDALCEKHNTKVVYTSWVNEDFKKEIKVLKNFIMIDCNLVKIDVARDKKHCGTISHTSFANEIWSPIKDLL